MFFNCIKLIFSKFMCNMSITFILCVGILLSKPSRSGVVENSKDIVLSVATKLGLNRMRKIVEFNNFGISICCITFTILHSNLYKNLILLE